MNAMTGEMTCNASADQSRRDVVELSISMHIVRQMRCILAAFLDSRSCYERSFYLGELDHSLNELARHSDEWADYMGHWKIPPEDD